jgi:dienelactone hydrolase
VEVRYRIKSWKRLQDCIDDCRAAIGLARERGAREVALLGFSMGGAVAIAAAGEPAVGAVLTLAPWIPSQLDLAALDGKRFLVLHGSLDAPLPGIPGITAASSRRGFERAVKHGADATYTIVRGALHGVALRGPGGRVLPLPRAGATAELLAAELRRFAGTTEG